MAGGPDAGEDRSRRTGLAGAVDGQALTASDAPLRAWPLAALLLLVALPALAAGPIRYLTGVPMGWATVLGTLFSLLILAPFAGAIPRRPGSAGQELMANATLLAVAIFAAAVPYNRHFHGLPN